MPASRAEHHAFPSSIGHWALSIEHWALGIEIVLGWDIGGVNTKVACVDGGRVVAVHSRPYELQRAPESLPSLLRELAAMIGDSAVAPHAVTMTAELSQMFRTKREGGVERPFLTS